MWYLSIIKKSGILLLFPCLIFSQNLRLLTPNNKETFNGGEKLIIKWETEVPIKGITLSFSFDKKMWYEIVGIAITGSGTYEWIIPYFKKEKKEVWLKIESIDPKMADTSRKPFTITAASPDAAEPNNSISTATPLKLGDTLCGLITMGYGGVEHFYNSDTQKVYSDTDFFAIIVEAGSLLIIKTLPDFDERNYYIGYLGSRVPAIFLMDSAGNKLTNNGVDCDSITFAISNSGIYYCGILSGGIFNRFAGWYHKYKITAQIRSYSFVKLEPLTGSFKGGDSVNIKWSGGDTTMTFTIYFSFDKKDWYVIGGGGGKNNGSYKWTIPYMKNEKKEVWLKIEEPVYKIVDSTTNPFTIKAAQPDIAEPNNSISTATSLKLGDTISGLITMGYGGKIEYFYNSDTQKVYADTDFFAITVSSKKLLFINVLPDFGKRLYCEGYLGSRVPALFLMDSKGKIMATNSPEMDSILVPISDSGTYYCGVLSGGLYPFAGWYHKYKITTREIAEVQNLSLSESAYVPYNNNYIITVVDSNTQLSLSLITKDKKEGSFTIASLPADSDVINLPTEKIPLSIVMIEPSQPVQSVIDSVSITLSYDHNKVSDPAKILPMWYNDSTGRWENVAFENDLQNNRIIIGSKHLSIYGVFQPALSIVVKREKIKSLEEYPLKLKSNSLKAINISTCKVITKDVKIILYSVNGKKILSKLFRAEEVSKKDILTLQLPLSLRSGTYVLRIVSGNIDKNFLTTITQ